VPDRPFDKKLQSDDKAFGSAEGKRAEDLI
jgi:hypothetical protein